MSGRIDPNLKALIVILGLDDIWDGTHPLAHHLLTTLPSRTVVRHAKTPTEALRYLNSTTRPYAIVITDAAVLKPEHRYIMPKLVHYARDGGTVIFDGAFAQRVGPAKLGIMFMDDWRVSWRAHEESFDETALNTFTNSKSKGNVGRIDPKGLAGKYATRANWIKGVALEDALHLDARVAAQYAAGKRRDKKGWRPPRGETYKTPYAFTVMGRGRLGYVGDVLYDQRSVKLIAAMCLYPGSRAHRPLGTGVPPPGPIEHKGPAEGARRPREFDVTIRCLQREMVKARKRKLAECNKDEANELFREGAWLQAAQLYRASAAIAAPEPTYMSNLAAALLKLELWKFAEGAASRALMHDPKHVKALYRRALARKELGLIDGAMSDITRLLATEPGNVPALVEQQALQRLQATSTTQSDAAQPAPAPTGSRSGKRAARRARQTEAEDHAIDVDYGSDTDDYEHEGNGIACRWHNRAAEGCRYTAAVCMFRHAPDWKSVRDDLGRNVCVYWLVGTCGKAASGTCLYAHDGTYLPREGGWWTDTGRLDRLRAEFDAAARADPLDLGAGRVKESILAEALIPPPFMQDAWVYADFDLPQRQEEDPREEDGSDVDSSSEVDSDDEDRRAEAMEAFEYEMRAMMVFDMVAKETGLSMEEKQLLLASELERIRFGM